MSKRADKYEQSAKLQKQMSKRWKGYVTHALMNNYSLSPDDKTRFESVYYQQRCAGMMARMKQLKRKIRKLQEK